MSGKAKRKNKIGLGKFNETINLSTYKKVETYNLHAYHHVIVARNKKLREQAVALRLRVGRVGYAQWLNEILVYLLPGFKHKNIADFLGFDKRYLEAEGTNFFTSDNVFEEYEKDSDDSYDSDSDNDVEDRFQEVPATATSPWKPVLIKGQKQKRELTHVETPLEYWVVNDYSMSRTLRNHLTREPLAWPQMIRIARGIADGLHYLHEHHLYQIVESTRDLGAEAYTRESDGHMKSFVYNIPGSTIHIEAPNLMTIVHRTLSSVNIVLRNGHTPCIWNFGTAHVYHPYHPMNYLTIMDKPNQHLIMNSVYTPPEILRGSSMFTSRALKAVDMYALGVIFWELLSRCKLPPLENVAGHEETVHYENIVRKFPGPYFKPLSIELKTDEPTCNLLHINVCTKKIRPTLKNGWTIGKKSNRFVNIIRDLWDEDYEARIQVATVIERLAVLSMRFDRDKLVRIVKPGKKHPPKPTTEPEVAPSTLTVMPTHSSHPHNDLPRVLDTSAPREEVRPERRAEVRYNVALYGTLGPTQQVSREQLQQLQQNRAQRRVQMQPTASQPRSHSQAEPRPMRTPSADPRLVRTPTRPQRAQANPARPTPSTSTGKTHTIDHFANS